MNLETDAIIVKITYAHKSGKGLRIHIPEAIVKALNIKKGDGFVWILNNLHTLPPYPHIHHPILKRNRTTSTFSGPKQDE